MNIAISIPNIENPISQSLKNPTKPIKGFLSLSNTIPFDNHPSARGLKKNENEKKENLKDNIKIINDLNIKLDNKEVNDENKKSTSFKFSLNYIEEKIYQNEVYYQKKENDSTKNYSSNLSLNFIPDDKKNIFTFKEKEFDNEITESIKKRESSDVIIKKFNIFANCK